MDVELFATMLQAQVLKQRDELQAAYDGYPDATMSWAIIDPNNSNLRISNGPRDGYIRGAAFLSLVRNVIAPYPEVRLIKEMGDAALLACNGFRPLLEALVLVGLVRAKIATMTPAEAYPFATRAAIGFGAAKRLMRDNEDFLGTTIDQLSRALWEFDPQAHHCLSLTTHTALRQRSFQNTQARSPSLSQ